MVSVSNITINNNEKYPVLFRNILVFNNTNFRLLDRSGNEIDVSKTNDQTGKVRILIDVESTVYVTGLESLEGSFTFQVIRLGSSRLPIIANLITY